MVTKSMLILTKPGEDTVLDCVPLDEVDKVVSVNFLAEYDRTGLSERATAAATAREGGEGEGPEPLKKVASMRRVKSFAATLAGTRRDNDDDGSRVCSFNIVTQEAGHNGGRIFSLRLKSPIECEEWMEVLLRAVTKARRDKELELEGGGWLNRLRTHARFAYNSAFSQMLFALIIVASFLVSLIDAELMPAEDSDAAKAFHMLEVAFTVYVFAECVFVLCFESARKTERERGSERAREQESGRARERESGRARAHARALKGREEEGWQRGRGGGQESNFLSGARACSLSATQARVMKQTHRQPLVEDANTRAASSLN